MEWLKLCGLCLLAAAMMMVLRQMQPAMAGLLSACFGVLLVGMLLPRIGAYIAWIADFLESLGLDEAYCKTMLKAMGIVLVTQTTVQICRDLDAPSVAQRAELCGRMALLGVSVPVFMQLTQMAVDVLR